MVNRKRNIRQMNGKALFLTLIIYLYLIRWNESLYFLPKNSIWAKLDNFFLGHAMSCNEGDPAE